MRRLIRIFFIIAISLSLSGCKKIDTSDIRTDSEPITRRFPSLPTPDRMYWQYEKQSGVGLDHHELALFAFYEDTNQFDAVKNQLVPDQKGLSIEPAFVPEELGAHTLSWRSAQTDTYFQEDALEPKAIAAYWCDQEQVLYLSMSWD